MSAPELVPATGTTAANRSATRDRRQQQAVTSSGPGRLRSTLHAFRRTWLIALATAVPLACLAGLAAWRFVPARYESFATLNLPGNISIGGLRSPHVLQAAVALPRLQQTRTLSQHSQPAEWLQRNLRVEAQDSGRCARVALVGTRPGELAAIVDGVKDTWLDQLPAAGDTSDPARADRLQARLRDQRGEAAARREQLDQLGETEPSLPPGESSLTLRGRLAALTSRREQLQFDVRTERDRIQRESRALTLSAHARQTEEPQDLNPPTLADDPRTDEARRRIRVLKELIAQYEEHAVDPGRHTVEFRAELAELQHQIRTAPETHVTTEPATPDADAGTRSDTESAPSAVLPVVDLSRLNSWLSELQSVESDIAETQQRLDARLLAESQHQREVAQWRSQREHETARVATAEREQERLVREIESLRSTSPDTPASIAHDAVVPRLPQDNRRLHTTVFAGLGVFALVLAGFTAHELSARRISTAAELRAEAGLRVLGCLPAPSRTGRGRRGNWPEILAESADTVRTHVLQGGTADGSAVVVVTSPSIDEGRTTLATELARSAARAGRRVAIVDCDFRKPSAHEQFDAQSSPGISELLRGEADLENITHVTNCPGLVFIPAGHVDDLSLRCLATDGGESVLDDLRSQYDVVVLDTSPLLFVAEPGMLARHADHVILTVRRDRSRLSFVQQSCETLSDLGAPLLGAVLVGTDSDVERQNYGYQQQIQS